MSTHPSQPANPTAASSSPTAGSDRHEEVGQVIGKYRIVRPVGVGGMAQVFLASREGPEGFAKPYVIKRILPELSQDEQFAKLFVIEAKVAAMLDHPNIVHVFDFEIENGNYYLVMEHVAGGSLAHLMRANRRRGVPLGPSIAVEIGAAVAHALAYAHDLTLPDGTPLDLVHRDISPGNVLISRDGAVKLADFGVVKTSLTTTVVGVVNGKWAYMSPEQISGQAVDQRSDLFSLGIVLYEVLTGVRLFRGESAAATASRVMDAKIRRPKAVVPDLDPRLDHIIMQMLERNPQARYQTAAALAADLEALRTTPVFSSGAFQLRNVVRALLPETSTPALGTSFSNTMGSGPQGSSNGPRAARTADDLEVALQAPAAVSPFGSGVSWRIVIAIAAGCFVASLIFWLFVF